MKPFHKIITELVTGQKAVQVMTMYWWLTALKTGITLFGAWNSYNSNKQAGQATYNAAYQNSASMLKYAGLNAELMMGAAERNAAALLRIGEANAAAIERATERNLGLYRLQAGEEVRRHIIGEKMIAGEIRAVAGSSGLMVNTGTPQAYLQSTVHEGITQRQYMQTRHKETLFAMAEEGADRAAIYRLTASENAAVVMANAHAATAVEMNNVRAATESQMQSAGFQQQSYNSAANNSLWSGIGSAVVGGLGIYNQYRAANPIQTFNGFGNTAPPTVAQNTPPAALTAPGYAGHTAYDPSWRYSGQLPSWYGQ